MEAGRLAPPWRFPLLHDDSLQRRAAIIAGIRGATPSAGTAASSRMLETLQLAHDCLAGREAGSKLATLLFYIDCEAFSTLGRPVTELPWTRAFASPTALVFDALEAGIVNRWLEHHGPDLMLTAEIPAGTRWLSGAEVKIIRHSVGEFCNFGERELRFVDRVRERAGGSTVVPEVPPEEAVDWGSVDAFLAETRDWMSNQGLPVEPGDHPSDDLSKAEEAALHREALLSISASE